MKHLASLCHERTVKNGLADPRAV
eukprot:COSAG03_NODE_23653_length_278_cov_0.581006_1_plen_23_part_01